ncbi:MAG: hypothetical protein ACE5EQ_08785, partial [Phycisphaerae bacterium]
MPNYAIDDIRRAVEGLWPTALITDEQVSAQCRSSLKKYAAEEIRRSLMYCLEEYPDSVRPKWSWVRRDLEARANAKSDTSTFNAMLKSHRLHWGKSGDNMTDEEVWYAILDAHTF